MTGDPATDVQSLLQWTWQFYTALQTALDNAVSSQSQTSAANWDPTDLPDPATTNIATAQQTANLAWKFANLINNTLANPIVPPTPPSFP